MVGYSTFVYLFVREGIGSTVWAKIVRVVPHTLANFGSLNHDFGRDRFLCDPK